MSDKKWYAIYTRPRYEKRVSQSLQDKGIICYLPLIKTMRQWSDRKKMVELPLFSSYLFVFTGTTQNEYYEILNTTGVVRFIAFGGKAIEIPGTQIENIRWLLSTEVPAESVNEKIEPGRRVEIIKGPLRGLKAEMVYYKTRNRIILRMEELDKSIEIQIPESYVQPL